MAKKSPDRIQIAAFTFIIVGTLFIVNDLGRWMGINFLALIILLPALFMLRNVYRAYRKRKSFDNNDLLQGGLGLLLFSIGITNLFNIELNIFSNIWPLAMIAAGAYLLFGQHRKD